MTGTTRARAAMLGAAILAVTAVLAVAAGAASASEVIYNNLQIPQTGEVAGFGGQDAQTSEFGGQVEFVGTARKNPTVIVQMSTWACETGNWPEKTCKTAAGAKFEWPITISVYEAGPGNSVGAKIAGGSKVYKIPYRPSESTKCTGENAGYWYRGGKCFVGNAFKISIGLKVAKLPPKAIISVSYNTSDYGAEPQRPKPCNATATGCPYDLLFVGVNLKLKVNEKGEYEVNENNEYVREPVSPSVGTYSLPEDAFINSAAAEYYCESPGGVGTFAISKGCWKYAQPAIEVKAN